MIYWRQILIYVLAGCYAIYFLSLIVTYLFYPAGPIYDLESDKVVGQRKGLTWFHFFMLIPFSLVNNWGFK